MPTGGQVMEPLSKITELEALARLQTAQLFALEKLVMAIIVASSDRERVQPAFRMLAADFENQLSESGFALSIDRSLVSTLKVDVQREVTRLERFLAKP